MSPGPNVDHLGLLSLLGYQVELQNHAKAILTSDFTEALGELHQVLGALSISLESLVRGGGGEHVLTQGLRKKLAALAWGKHNFDIKKMIDGKLAESISHEVDHVRRFGAGNIALEIEWNNKDPFFDRDLENFKRLHAEGAISVGIILTRGSSIQEDIRSLIFNFAIERKFQSFEDLIAFGLRPTERQTEIIGKQAIRPDRGFARAWADAFVSDKFGEATTHWKKLEDRVHRGVGNPCPLLLLGIPSSLIVA
jgi:Restriction endonuclease BglII